MGSSTGWPDGAGAGSLIRVSEVVGLEGAIGIRPVADEQVWRFAPNAKELLGHMNGNWLWEVTRRLRRSGVGGEIAETARAGAPAPGSVRRTTGPDPRTVLPDLHCAGAGAPCRWSGFCSAASPPRLEQLVGPCWTMRPDQGRGLGADAGDPAARSTRLDPDRRRDLPCDGPAAAQPARHAWRNTRNHCSRLTCRSAKPPSDAKYIARLFLPDDSGDARAARPGR